MTFSGQESNSLTPGPSFDHNLCCRCPNGSCEAILDIYISRPFQWYRENLNARCFDPYNRALSFQKSRRTPKSHFRECEWRPHTSLKVGLRHLNTCASIILLIVITLTSTTFTSIVIVYVLVTSWTSATTTYFPWNIIYISTNYHFMSIRTIDVACIWKCLMWFLNWLPLWSTHSSFFMSPHCDSSSHSLCNVY